MKVAFLICVIASGICSVRAESKDDNCYILPEPFASARDALIHVKSDTVYALLQVKDVMSSAGDTSSYFAYGVYNLTTGDSSALLIPIDVTYPFRFTSFSISSDTLIAVDLAGVLVFQRVGSLWKLTRFRRLENSFLSSRVLGDTILLWNHVPMGYGKRASIYYQAQYSVAVDSVVEVIDYEQDSTYLLTYVQPRHTLSCNRTICAQASLTSYQVQVFEKNELRQTLARSIADWRQFLGAVPKLDSGVRPQSQFPALTEIIRQSSTIDAVHLLRGNDIAVYWSTPHAYDEKIRRKYYLDLWKYEKGTWVLSMSDRCVFPLESGAEFDLEGEWMTPRHSCDGEHFVDYQSYPGEAISKRSWSTHAGYRADLERYALRGEPRICVRVRSVQEVRP